MFLGFAEACRDSRERRSRAKHPAVWTQRHGSRSISRGPEAADSDGLSRVALPTAPSIGDSDSYKASTLPFNTNTSAAMESESSSSRLPK